MTAPLDDRGRCRHRQPGARRDRRQRSAALPGRHLVPLFRAAAARRPGALLPREPLRPLLVGDQVQGHHAGRGQPPGLFLGLGTGGIPIEDQPKDMERPSFIRMDPPTPRRAAQGGQPGRRAGQPCQHGRADPRADRPGARRLAAQRDLRLGRPGVDRADDDDARDPVRLSLGRPAPADLLVRCRDRQCPLARLRRCIRRRRNSPS